jgi:alkanesulfonate monooxygenase SsuD/methylene tetrahydromethanopterin reductase-like flavin-dependent oxidoreductase (luciferase family)
MRLSIAFTGFGGLESTMPAVLAAERSGLDGVWTAEHIGFHDAVVPSALYLRETKRLEVGLVGLSTASRHPGMTAMELLSLSEIGPGRVRVAVGTGDPSLVAKLGKTITKPLGANAALIGALRETMRGSDLTIDHGDFSFRGFRAIPFGPPVPIDLMAIRPKMIRLAATNADGLSISMGASREYIRETVEAVERELVAAGKNREHFRITAIGMGIIAEDLDAAVGPVKAMLSMFPQETAEYLAKGAVEPGSLVEAAKRGPMAVMKAWSLEAITGTMLACTPAGIRRALRSYADTGIDELSLVLAADPETQPAIVEQIAAARP